MVNVIKGFALSGEEVLQLKDKHFEIIGEPRYESMPDLEDPTKNREKLVLLVRTTAGESDYYPNKTSQRVIMERAGRNLAKWLGFKSEFFTREMMVGKIPKNVIFIK